MGILGSDPSDGNRAPSAVRVRGVCGDVQGGRHGGRWSLSHPNEDQPCRHLY